MAALDSGLLANSSASFSSFSAQTGYILVQLFRQFLTALIAGR